MQSLWAILLISVILSMLGSSRALAVQSKDRPAQKAILLVAFGTSVPEAAKAFEQIDAQAKAAFPGAEIRWAFTSRVIRAKLAKEGKQLDSPETALARLMADGFTHVAVLSLHVIPGKEFHDLNRNALLFGDMAEGFQRVLVARPLLSSHQDMVRVANAMLKRIPADREAEDAVIFMGHGSENHPADAIYSAMNYTLQELTPKVYVGTVQGYPGLDDILPKLGEEKIKKVYLIPFMAVAGDHARNDMAGDKPDSWKSVLVRNGYTCETILSGMGENPEIVQVWLDHLSEIYSHL